MTKISSKESYDYWEGYSWFKVRVREAEVERLLIGYKRLYRSESPLGASMYDVRTKGGGELAQKKM